MRKRDADRTTQVVTRPLASEASGRLVDSTVKAATSRFARRRVRVL